MVDEIFERFRLAHGVPGVAYGIVVDGVLAHASGVGVRDLTTDDRPGPETVFRIASMTKSVTAMCVLLLRDDGVLSLDQPAVTYVPELKSLKYPTTDSPPITLRMLLSMSAGFVEDDRWADLQLNMEAQAFDALLAAGLSFTHAPATTYEYSNLGYAIVGRVVAAAAGVPVRTLATERLLNPLGMADTTWDFERVPLTRRAVGYRREGGELVVEPALPDGAFGPIGGLSSSVRDLARLVGLHLSAWPARDDPDTGPLRRSSLREMAVAHWAGPSYLGPRSRSRTSAEGYGFGLMAAHDEQYGRLVAHSGGLPGYGSHMKWLPDCGAGVIALSNRTYSPVHEAVRETIEVLAATGVLHRAAPPPSTELIAAQTIVSRLYQGRRIDPEAVLETYFLDRDDARRPPDLLAMRDRYGALVSVAPIVSAGRLGGHWRMTCERGELDVSVVLGPTLPTRIQFIGIKPISDAASPSTDQHT